MDETRQFLPIGFVVEGYRIEAVLGADAAAVVYRALDPRGGRRVVIEEFFPAEIARRGPAGMYWPGDEPSAIRARGIAALAKYAHALAAVAHPALARVRGVFEAAGTAYLVLDDVPGRRLAAILDEGGQVASNTILRLAEGALSALEVLHAAGLLHGNIRAETIVVSGAGAALLTGHAGWRQALAAELVGAPADPYAPPEARNGERWGPASDLYALGAVLYRAVTGVPPPAPSERKRGGDLALPVGAEFDRSFVGTLDQALAWNPAKRPQSADAFRRLMPRGERVLGSSGRTLASPSLARAARRHPYTAPRPAGPRGEAASPSAKEDAGTLCTGPQSTGAVKEVVRFWPLIGFTLATAAAVAVLGFLGVKLVAMAGIVQAMRAREDTDSPQSRD